ncbi:hypothetical protein [Streptomyces sp. ODS28]|uniref:hypothetical protein n=1 Tax=Streptomyces sp. ODS28 TaxID=3136688 RepID=UPI0031E882F6
MDEKDKASRGGEGEPRSKRIDLSFAQVAGSAVAAVVAAVLAGQLGVYGTFIGAGVVSVVATTGGPLFQHFFRRTGEEIKVKTSQGNPRVRQVSVRNRDGSGYRDVTVTTMEDPGERSSQDQDESPPEVAATAQIPEGVRESDEATRLLDISGTEGDPENTDGTRKLDPDPGRTRTGNGLTGHTRRDVDRVQMVSTDEVTRMLGRAETGTGAGAAAGGPAAGDETALMPQAGAERTGAAQTGAADGEEGDDEFTDPTTHGTKWRGWKRTLVPALLVFLIAVGGISAFELISGDSVSGGKGTSVGRVFHGGGSGSEQSPGDGTNEQPGGSGGSGEQGTTGGSHDGTDPSQAPGQGSAGERDGGAGDGGTSGDGSSTGGSGTTGGSTGGDSGGSSGTTGGSTGGDSGGTSGGDSGSTTGGDSGGTTGGDGGTTGGDTGDPGSTSDGGSGDQSAQSGTGQPPRDAPSPS